MLLKDIGGSVPEEKVERIAMELGKRLSLGHFDKNPGDSLEDIDCTGFAGHV